MSASWIGVDWGSTNVRLWALDAAGEVIGTRTAPQGGEHLTAADYEGILIGLAADFLPGSGTVPVIISGMAGARQGWFEAPYRTVPCAVAGEGAIAVPTEDGRIAVRIVSGLSQSDPPDVMRGEETQIAGLVAGSPEFDGIVCLPGTHSKWVRVQGGRVEWFRTLMTGELFALLSERSVLRHSVGEGWSDAAFDAGVRAALADPDALMPGLFALRSEALLGDLDGGNARARLSGLLIGAELSAMRTAWTAYPVAIVASAALARRYEAALAPHGAQVTRCDGEALTLAGLRANRAILEAKP